MLFDLHTVSREGRYTLLKLFSLFIVSYTSPRIWDMMDLITFCLYEICPGFGRVHSETTEGSLDYNCVKSAHLFHSNPIFIDFYIVMSQYSTFSLYIGALIDSFCGLSFLIGRI